MKCIIHTDGGSRGNPGPAAAGVVIRDTDTGELLHEAGYFLGTTTNNVAEYQGLLRALEIAQQLEAEAVTIHSDSELLVRQIEGKYRVKSADLKPLHARAMTLLDHFGKWSIEHVRRDGNQRADELVNLALDARRDVTGTGDASGAAPEGVPGPVSATIPCWTAELTGKRSQCLAGQATGNAYTFGPTTPEGFCIHAAAAVLTKGPLQWRNGQREGQTHCQACGQGVRMVRVM